LDFEFLEAVGIGNGDSAAEMSTTLQIVNLNSIHLKIVVAGMRSADDQVVVYSAAPDFARIEHFGPKLPATS